MLRVRVRVRVRVSSLGLGLGLVLSFGIEGDVQTGTEPSSFLVQDTGL